MNRLHTVLAEWARNERLAEKWVLAPSRRVGHQWLETVARSGEPLFNFRVLTLRSLALEIAGPRLVAEGRRFISSFEQTLLVDTAWQEVQQEFSSQPARYLADLPPRPSLAAALSRSIAALRLAECPPSQLQPAQFLSEVKGRELCELARRYQQKLDDEQVCDFPQVLQWATARLREEAFVVDDEVRLLVPDDIRPERLEQRFLLALPQSRRFLLPTDRSDRRPTWLAGWLPESDTSAESQQESQEPPVLSNARRLAYYRTPHQAPPAADDDTLQIFSAQGESNEVREVLRRCAATGTRLDDVEVLYTDPETYIPLLYELCQRERTAEGDDFTKRFPITFAEGIPITYSRPGRALRAWLEWMEFEYPQKPLIRMVQAGLVDVKSGSNQLSAAEATGVLRALPIGKGHGRYLDILKSEIRQLRESLKTSPDNVSGDDAEQERETRRQEAIKRQLKSLQTLQKWLRSLLSITGPVVTDDEDLLTQSIQFLEKVATHRGEIDELARVRLVDEIQALRDWRENVDGDVSLSYFRWLMDLPARLAVKGSGPQAGHLHAARLPTGGHSGRRHLFVLGLDESRFPGTILQDPLMLDEEREQLSPHLEFAHMSQEHRLSELTHLFARQRGSIILSYSCLQIQDDREMFPSSLILAAHRLLTDNPDADFSTLFKALPSPASFAPADPKQILNEADWWLFHFARDFSEPDLRNLIDARYPHLKQGRIAATAREAQAFTEYEGLVPEAGKSLSPYEPNPRPVSPSRLETVGKCPLRFFFQYGLRVEPLEEFDAFAEEWLDALQFGSLMHAIFYRFVQHLVSEDRPPNNEDWELLWETAKELIEEYRVNVPPPNESAFRDRERIVRRCCEIFLREEILHCEEYAPRYLEASLGLVTQDDGTPIDCSESIPITLDNGQVLHARGRIDRVDEQRSEPGRYGIWDYKTGNASRFVSYGPFHQGRMIQSVLYCEMLELVLRDHTGPDVEVDHFGYFFPSARSSGRRIQWSKARLSAGRSIVQHLAELIRSGTFVATPDKGDCMFCDYKSICGDITEVTARSKSKLENCAGTEAEGLRILRASK